MPTYDFTPHVKVNMGRRGIEENEIITTVKVGAVVGVAVIVSFAAMFSPRVTTGTLGTTLTRKLRSYI